MTQATNLPWVESPIFEKLLEENQGTPEQKAQARFYHDNGYLVVKKNGDVLCYHSYNKNQFEDYLFYNTKLDTASTDKFSFGDIYKENDDCYFKLNLQIRFNLKKKKA